MGRGVQIDFTLNPRDFIKGLKLIETSTEDVVDALGDLDAADVDLDTGKAEKGLGDLEDAAGDAEQAFGDLSSEAKSELGKVETAASDAGKEVESELKDGASDAEKAFGRLGSGAKADMRKVETAADDAGREVGDIEDEAASSAKEFGASFRGDPVEALEEVQALTSELANKLIPGVGGAVLSIASGVAFGALLGFYEKWKEQQEEVNGRVRDFRDTVLESLGVLDAETIRQAITDQLDAAGIKATDLRDTLDTVPDGLREGFSQAVQSGDLDALAALAADVQSTADTIQRDFVAWGTPLTAQQQAILDLDKALGGVTGELADGVAEADALATVLGTDGTYAAGSLTGALGDAAAAAEDVGTGVRNIPDRQLPNLVSSTASARDNAREAKQAVDDIDDKTVTITVKQLGNRRLPL